MYHWGKKVASTFSPIALCQPPIEIFYTTYLRRHRGSTTHFRPWLSKCPFSNYLDLTIASSNFEIGVVMRCLR